MDGGSRSRSWLVSGGGLVQFGQGPAARAKGKRKADFGGEIAKNEAVER